MEKFSELTAHIVAILPGVDRDQVDGFIDLGELTPTGEDLGHGLEVGTFTYDATISIENCPAEIAKLLLVALSLWLDNNDPDRDEQRLSDPEINITKEDNDTVYVQITVEFKESLQIVLDPEGRLDHDGQKWRVSNVPIDTAETIDKFEKK